MQKSSKQQVVARRYESGHLQALTEELPGIETSLSIAPAKRREEVQEHRWNQKTEIYVDVGLKRRAGES